MPQAEVKPTDAEANQPSADVDNAQEPSLDDLLAEYEEPKVEPEKEQPKETAQSSPTDIEAFVRRQMQKDMDDALKESAETLKSEFGDTELPVDWFEGQLYRAGAKDPRITKAFEERNENPGRWKSILSEMGKEMKAQMKQTDKAATDSWNAVEASVHSASMSKQPEPEPDWGSMTDAQFQAAKMKLGRK